MPVVDLFHERERLRMKGDTPDVLTYDLPEQLRVQIVHAWRGVLPHCNPRSWQLLVWQRACKLLYTELGRFELISDAYNEQREIEGFFLAAPVPEALSTLEALFAEMSRLSSIDAEREEAVRTINERFRKHGVGFEFDGTHVLRIDNQYIHSEAVRPALLLLSQKGFGGANAEFLSAHEHYREGRHEEAMVAALKAFESTIKCIAKIRSIPLDPTLTAAPLIDAMVAAGVLPASQESHLKALVTALKSGLPTLRNKTAGHGSGPEVREVPRHVAAHCLHLAAANIVFLVESHIAKT